MKSNLQAVLFAVILIFSLASCSKDNDQVVDSPAKTFVIVPGAWQAPFAWQFVKSQLEAAGQKVHVVLLPGHGADQSAPQNLTMDVYREKVISVMDSIPGKVILVGHSLAGVVVSEVAEKRPEKIEKLIYIAAFVPLNGQTLFDLANTDATSLLGQSIIPSADMLTLDVKHENILNTFIQDGSASVQALVTQNYRVEPAIPFTNAVTLTTAKYGSVDKYYIHTIQDHAVTYILQKRMVQAAGLKNIYQLNTSHSPFLSKPDSVSILLLKIAK